jgi:hypothetical protein
LTNILDVLLWRYKTIVLYKGKRVLKIQKQQQTKPNQTKPNQTKPNQTKPNQTKPNQTKPNQTNSNTTYKKQTLNPQSNTKTGTCKKVPLIFSKKTKSIGMRVGFEN